MTHVQLRQDKIRDLIINIRGDSISRIDKLVLVLDKQALHGNPSQVYNEQVLTKYDGLMEKFDILGRSDLSSQLEPRIKEVMKATDKDFHCLEMLDFLSRMSRDPLNAEPANLIDETSKETTDDDKIDLDELFDDEIPFEEPDYNDTLSEWSDITDVSEPSTEPPTTLHRSPSPKPRISSDLSNELTDKMAIMDNLNRSAYWSQAHNVVLSEADVLREALLASQGISGYLFDIQESGVIANRNAIDSSNLAHLSHEAFTSTIDKFGDLAVNCVKFRHLSQHYYVKKKCSAFNYRYVCGLLQSLVDELDAKLLSEEYSLINDPQSILSLTDAHYKLNQMINPYRKIIYLFDCVFMKLEQISCTTSVALLDCLLNQISATEINNDQESSLLLQKLFIGIFNHFINEQGLSNWLFYGEIPSERTEISDMFVLKFDTNCPISSRWNEWCKPNISATPEFLAKYMEEIITCGKISYFLQTAKSPRYQQSFVSFNGSGDQFFHQKVQLYCEYLIQETTNINKSLIKKYLLPDIEKILLAIRNVFFMLEYSADESYDFDDILSFKTPKNEQIPIWHNLSIVMDNVLDAESRNQCQHVYLLLFRLERLHNLLLKTPNRDFHLFTFISILRNHIYQSVIQGIKPPLISDKFEQSILNLRNYISTVHETCFLQSNLLDIVDCGTIDSSLIQNITNLISSYESEHPLVKEFQLHISL